MKVVLPDPAMPTQTIATGSELLIVAAGAEAEDSAVDVEAILDCFYSGSLDLIIEKSENPSAPISCRYSVVKKRNGRGALVGKHRVIEAFLPCHPT